MHGLIVDKYSNGVLVRRDMSLIKGTPEEVVYYITPYLLPICMVAHTFVGLNTGTSQPSIVHAWQCYLSTQS